MVTNTVTVACRIYKTTLTDISRNREPVRLQRGKIAAVDGILQDWEWGKIRIRVRYPAE